MEILINEMSLKGQFGSVDEFISDGLKPLILLLSQIDSSRDVILKKYDFYDCKVTSTVTLHQLFKGSYSRTCDEIRKVKSQLSVLLDKPYWQDSQKHKRPDDYQFNGADIFDSSLAESCERDKVVISFICTDYNTAKLEVIKNSININVDNLYDQGTMFRLVRERGLIVDFSITDTSRFKRTRFNIHGKIVYKELKTNCFWHLDTLHKDHYEVYNSIQEHIGITDLAGIVDATKRIAGRSLLD